MARLWAAWDWALDVQRWQERWRGCGTGRGRAERQAVARLLVEWVQTGSVRQRRPVRASASANGGGSVEWRWDRRGRWPVAGSGSGSEFEHRPERRHKHERSASASASAGALARLRHWARSGRGRRLRGYGRPGTGRSASASASARALARLLRWARSSGAAGGGEAVGRLGLRLRACVGVGPYERRSRRAVVVALGGVGIGEASGWRRALVAVARESVGLGVGTSMSTRRRH